ncbi:PRC-barrel domain containing protein [Salinarimonas soli]|uniref:PRC-barrel domain containing protein n=2 Tax=Salinarimonas soli TaxID=1638099 RepID=A0A5B2VGW1_9HYPH|nr:PRC-barrel domain containing protein [Salinarimonas soli]
MGASGSTASSDSAAGSSGSTMSSSGSTAGSAPSSSASASAGGAGSMQQLQQGQFLASDLIGTRVVGQNNEAIGDVNDVVMGADGKAMAVLVGVGGFLGIGEKDVAIPFDQAKVMFDNNDGKSGGSGAPNTTGSTAAGGASTGGNTAANNASAASHEPQRIVINMTKEQLTQAPAFRANGGSNASGNSSSGASSGGSTAPAGGATRP